MMTISAVAPPVCPTNVVHFFFKTRFFFPKSSFILFATIYSPILHLEEETAEEYNCI